jgi:hypothetical protein
LKKYFSISTLENVDGNENLVSFHSQKYSPTLSKISTESAGLVLGMTGLVLGMLM